MKEKHIAYLVNNKLKSEQPRRRENGYVVVKVHKHEIFFSFFCMNSILLVPKDFWGKNAISKFIYFPLTHEPQNHFPVAVDVAIAKTSYGMAMFVKPKYMHVQSKIFVDEIFTGIV